MLRKDKDPINSDSNNTDSDSATESVSIELDLVKNPISEHSSVIEDLFANKKEYWISKYHPKLSKQFFKALLDAIQNWGKKNITWVKLIDEIKKTNESLIEQLKEQQIEC